MFPTLWPPSFCRYGGHLPLLPPWLSPLLSFNHPGCLQPRQRPPWLPYNPAVSSISMAASTSRAEFKRDGSHGSHRIQQQVPSCDPPQPPAAGFGDESHNGVRWSRRFWRRWGLGRNCDENPMLGRHGARIHGVLIRMVAKRGREIELGGPHG